MSWVYGHYKYVNSFSEGIDFRRQNLTSTVSDPPSRSGSQKQKNYQISVNIYMLQYASFEALDFKIVRGRMPLDPSRAYKRLDLSDVVKHNK